VNKKSLVITSIAAPNAAMKIYAEKCKENGIDFIVIGDVTSPKHFQLDNCRFVSIEDQCKLPFKLAKLLPEKHYSRKNIGYLIAKDCDVIIETDDDNYPKEIFWKKSFLADEGRIINRKGWVNAYKYFTKENIWPRGFPLEEIQKDIAVPNQISVSLNIPIIQGLADENPDVDAIYRMTQALPITFDRNSPLVLSEGSWCPFNSQNTAWKKETFPLLYLPSYCSFRMTDIWRSLIAQRIAWTCGWNILFHQADVYQKRNEHNLVKDFEDEVPGYLNNSRIVAMLEDLDLKSGVDNMGENLMRCYSGMVDGGFLDKEELSLIDWWIIGLEI
jgi:hypothetical protein